MASDGNGSLAPTTEGEVDGPHISRNASIGLIADPHYRTQDVDELDTFIETATNRFNRNNVDRVVVVGDLIMETDGKTRDRERVQQVTEQVNEVDAPVTYLAGNHDTEHLSPDEFAATVDQQSTHGLFALTDNITGIFLDSSGPDRPKALGYLPDEQLEFLEEALETVEQAVVFVHHPVHYHDLAENNWFRENPEAAFCQNKFQFTEIVEEYDNVLAVVNGHTHLRNHTEYKGNHHLTVNAANREQPNDEAPTGMHALLDVSRSRLRMRHYRWSEQHPVDDTVIPLTDAQVALGGTFDPVHDGHRNLFRRAFQLGDLTVGLTSDDLAPQTRHEPRFILPFEERKASLEAVLAEMSHRHDRDYEVVQLDSPQGVVADSEDITHLIVTPETVGRAVDINEERAENGLEPLTIEVVEPLSAEDGDRISSTRICKGEIDPHGNLTPNANGRAPPN